MHTPRKRHTATLLNDGTVLVIGGQKSEIINSDDTTLSAVSAPDAEIYNPALNAWEPVGSPNQPRVAHTATLLKNGSVLIFGGADWESSNSSVEIFNPVQQSWKIAGPPKGNRFEHTATLLDSGEVMMAGGLLITSGSCNVAMLDIVDVFNPLTQTWRTATSAEFRRNGHTATRLNDGSILLIGGEGAAPFLTVIPDPRTLKQTEFTPPQAE